MGKKTAGASAARRAQPANRNETGKRTLPKAAEPFRFKPGVSGNPSGRPKNDIAATIARAIFEGNVEVIMLAMLKKIRKGDPKTFTALADRGYGKAPQHIEMSGDVTAKVQVEYINVAALSEP